MSEPEIVTVEVASLLAGGGDDAKFLRDMLLAGVMNASCDNRLIIPLEDGEFSKIDLAAQKQGVTIRKWIIETLRAALP